MSDLTASLDPAATSSASQLSGIGKKAIKNLIGCATSTSNNVGSPSTIATSSSSSSSTLASSWSLFLTSSLISASSSLSSSSSSSSSPDIPSAWYSSSTSYEEEAALVADSRQNLTLPSSSSSSSQTSSRSEIFGDSASISATKESRGRVFNRQSEIGIGVRDKGEVGASSNIFSTFSSGILDGQEVEGRSEEDQARYRSSVNHNWEEKEDEGFASGDESGDDSEPDDDYIPLNTSTSRNIQVESAERSSSSESSLDTKLLESAIDGDTDLLFRFVDTMEELESMSFNGSSYNENSSSYYWNSSHYNETYIVMGEGMYPSGYSLLQIILASIAATILMIVVVVGNMLVIIAIATEKALKNIQNWFIASLAVADFFLGLIIMPFSLANEIMGYWIFGYWWCDIYSAMDVLLCTASIMNLCLISLDRFWSITQAIKYLKRRTPARAALMITLVWLLSALICIPPLLGWKRPAPAEEYPKCSVSHWTFFIHTFICIQFL